jgi:hypothetical protein
MNLNRESQLLADSTTLHSPPIAAFEQLADANRVTAVGEQIEFTQSAISSL